MRKGFNPLSASKTFLGSFALLVTSALNGSTDHDRDHNRTTSGSHPVYSSTAARPLSTSTSKPTTTKSTGFFSSFFGGSSSHGSSSSSHGSASSGG